jgi:hypothetical protein
MLPIAKTISVASTSPWTSKGGLLNRKQAAIPVKVSEESSDDERPSIVTPAADHW